MNYLNPGTIIYLKIENFQYFKLMNPLFPQANFVDKPVLLAYNIIGRLAGFELDNKIKEVLYTLNNDRKSYLSLLPVEILENIIKHIEFDPLTYSKENMYFGILHASKLRYNYISGFRTSFLYYLKNKDKYLEKEKFHPQIGSVMKARLINLDIPVIENKYSNKLNALKYNTNCNSLTGDLFKYEGNIEHSMTVYGDVNLEEFYIKENPKQKNTQEEY